MFRNFATGRAVTGSALTIGLLDYFSDWKDLAALIAQSRLPSNTLKTAVAGLHRASLLQRSDVTPPTSEALMGQWQSWNPAAGFFHFSTKDARYVGKGQADRLVRERAALRPAPAPGKPAGAASLTKLPDGDPGSRGSRRR